ncbi:MAG: 2-hydroxyhepta-2,4-diene-1,7-dioate isomerase [Verrucomicrobiaceae bacterium]|nr:2-hydroxyhepta-2,4-diene-1,7-dioate isomerase [Verrucomicrobiaceae bacterium]
MIKVYRGKESILISDREQVYEHASFSFDQLFRASNPKTVLEDAMREGTPVSAEALNKPNWLPPMGNQEVWAAGVTYFRSREARMEESEDAGGDVFYDMVYEADRPELFFKATPARTRGHGAPICIRKDSTWDVPEPELTLAINSQGKIFGYTIGDDVSSRSIEGENPLYLPQAKVYCGSCAIGPALCLGEPPSKDTGINLTIRRNGEVAFEDRTTLHQLKRSLEELVDFLYRDNEFPDGALLMTGTGIVPSTEFTLQSGDVVTITIDGLGTLENAVA